jgi:hypothetical protein
MAALTPATSYAARGQWTTNSQSVYSFELKPNVWKEIYQQYGKAFGWFDWASLMGNEISLTKDDLTIFETYAYRKLITLGSVISTGSAGATVTFTLSAANYDSKNNAILRTTDKILIPGTYMSDTSTDYEYVVTGDDGGIGVAKVYTAMPVNKAGTNFSAAHITTQVPIGTKLAIVGDAHTRNSGQPKGLTNGSYYRVFYTTMSKTSFDMGGGLQFQDNYVSDVPLKGGRGTGTFNRAYLQFDFNLNRKINDNIFMGQEADNTSLVATDYFGNSEAYKSTRGYKQWLDKLALKKTYTDKWEFADLDDIKPLMTSVGEVAQDILVGCGDLFYRDWENSSYEAIKEFSGGTDLFSKAGEFGLQVTAFKKQGFRFMAKEFTNLSDPNSLGAEAYADRYRTMAFMVPMEDNPVQINPSYIANGEAPVKLKAFMLGYPQNHGEDRKRTLGFIKGMSGNSNVPGQIVSEYDADKGMLSSEYMPIFTGLQKQILITKA